MVLMIGCHQTITYVVLNVSLAQSFENVTTENLSKRNVVCNNFWYKFCASYLALLISHIPPFFVPILSRFVGPDLGPRYLQNYQQTTL